MLSKIYGCGLLGVDGYIVTVETDVANGLPYFSVVGLPDAGIRESKERVHSALKNSGLQFPMQRITINLAPADLKKEGSAFDLPIAIGLLVSSGQLIDLEMDRYVISGELSLSGEVRGVPGILPMTLAAKSKGFRYIIVPDENKNEAAIVDGITVLPVKHLNEVVEHLKKETEIRPCKIDLEELLKEKIQKRTVNDFSEVKGQESVKRALIIAAAGGHNLLMSGPPGAGKTMMARAFPTILPDLTVSEVLEITKIYSISGLLRDGKILTERPFRSPHHTISNISLVGGGRIPKPGEVSLAHLGVLFLDELPEFSKSALETLRQPIEDHEVTIARVNSTLTYPASFMLIAGMNPCPCGHYGDPTHECTCSENEIHRYIGKISGPMMDRIDIRVEVPATKISDLQNKIKGQSSAEIRKNVNLARLKQNQRYAHDEGVFFNAQLSAPLIEKYCILDEQCLNFLEMTFKKLKLSARGYHRIIKLARTIADLDDAENINIRHLTEAVQYRTN